MPQLVLEHIELHNFKSYRGGHSFQLPSRPGLYFLTGKNKDNSRLGANGIGKSTLLDAIFWACYGRSLRGLRGAEIITRGQKTASVTLTLHVGDQRYVIRRTQAPNLLTVNKLTVDQPYVDKLLRLTPIQFTYSVIFPQFGKPFFELAPAAKLELFSEIMGLNFWLDKSKQAQDEADQLADEIAKFEREATRQEAQYEALERELPGLKAKQADVKDLNRIVAGFKAKLEKAQQDQHAAREKAQKAREVNAIAKAAVDTCHQVVESLSKLGAKCPICLQTVSAAHLRAEKARAVGYLTQQKTHAEAALAQSKAATQRADLLATDERVIQGNLADWSRKLAEAASYAKLVQSKQAQMDALAVSITNLDTRLDRLVVRHEKAQFWVAGFKRVRLFIIDEILRQLELEVNNNLSALGLPDWQITFDVERENKSGGITKGFATFVVPPGSGEPVRLEAWSGGEYQRLRWAGELGLANLIMDRAGLVNSIEFYDEPSRHLSTEGVADLADTLAQRADDTERVIFLVDHASIESGNFTGVITVTKDEKGSALHEN